MEAYTLYPPGREPRRRSAIPLMMAALAMAGAFTPGPTGNSFEPYRAPESDEERRTRWEREAAAGRERAAAAQARREKREARRQADRERTARQQGRTLEVNVADEGRR